MLKKFGNFFKGAYDAGFGLGSDLRKYGPAAAGAGLMCFAGSALALSAEDKATVESALTTAKTDALSVGWLVIGFVAALVVIGVIMAFIKRA